MSLEENSSFPNCKLENSASLEPQVYKDLVCLVNAKEIQKL